MNSYMLNSVPQWLSYIESLHPQAMELGLTRIQSVAQRLEVLDFQCPVITVGGTNGKGSCVAFLEAILIAAGYKVGAYTSPHLLVFNERVRIAGMAVNDDQLIAAFKQVDIARGDISLTYFEFITLAALVIFQSSKPDILLLEVGLGGRLDAVNIVDPDVAIVTSVALDHMDWLGATREAIGYEKAGIFRSGKPAICGDFNPPASVIEAAEKLQAPFYGQLVSQPAQQRLEEKRYANTFFITDLNSAQPNSWSWQYQETIYKNLPIPHLPLQNAATALMALYCLKDRLEISMAAITQGLQQAWLPGRFQTLYQREQQREIILDVAHNPAAASYLAKRMAELPANRKVHAVVSILADKDITETLRPLLPLVDIWYVAGLALPRGSAAENIANHLQSLGVAAYDVRLAESVSIAFQEALSASQPSDRILVFGSFHTVAAVLEAEKWVSN
jgi:dihydrofolate synthase/folylpolyglutamate synthase